MPCERAQFLQCKEERFGEVMFQIGLTHFWRSRRQHKIEIDRLSSPYPLRGASSFDQGPFC